MPGANLQLADRAGQHAAATGAGARRLPPQVLLRWSVAVAAVTIALKAAAWWVSGSVSLLSDAIEGLVNLAGAVFALMMVTWAAQPPDEGHPYGHHKAEYFSSGFEGVLIVGGGHRHRRRGGQRLFHPRRCERSGWASRCRCVHGAQRRARLG